jgi:hypothetical protein
MDLRMACARVCVAAAAAVWTAGAGAQGTDLDVFMRQVLDRRDDNWKKLQQYVLNEREAIDVKGPGQVQIWGERREYSWYIRDGFFVRSPVRFNGVAIGEQDRRKYEDDYLKREQRRDARRRARDGAGGAAQSEPDAASDQLSAEGLLRQSREPEFVSSAYFLKFRFDAGQYALVGRETIDGRELLTIEYYPTNLFRGTDRRRDRNPCTGADCGERRGNDKAYDAEFRRLMNKTALVTLWVEPAAHQIVKYTFDNVALDFLPAQWLLHMDELHASMIMSQPFAAASPGGPEAQIWLPATLDFQAALSVAVGQFDVHYGVQYQDYRKADVTSKITIPKVK